MVHVSSLVSSLYRGILAVEELKIVYQIRSNRAQCVG